MASAARAKEDSARLPFKPCWRQPTENISRFSGASDKVSSVYLPFLGGEVRKIETETGETLWSAEPGGEILSDVLLEGDSLYTVSGDISRTDASIVVSSLSAATGLARWRTRIAFERSSGRANFYLLSDGGKLALSASEGRIFILEKETGGRAENFDLNEEITAPPVKVPGGGMIVGTANKVLFLSAETRRISVLLAAKNGSRTVYADERMFLVGDALGNVSAHSYSGRKTLWKIRTGARITDVLKMPEGFMISSNDNFVYFFSADKGARLWRTRLPERTLATALGRDIGAFTGLAGSEAFFLESEKGKIVNRLILNESDRFISRLFVNERFLVGVTETGLVGFSSTGCK